MIEEGEGEKWSDCGGVVEEEGVWILEYVLASLCG